jgi:hypothetical protein
MVENTNENKFVRFHYSTMSNKKCYLDRSIDCFGYTPEEYFELCLRNRDTMMTPYEDLRIVSWHFEGASAQVIADLIQKTEREVQLRLRMLLSVREMGEIPIEEKMLILKSFRLRARSYIRHKRTLLSKL